MKLIHKDGPREIWEVNEGGVLVYYVYGVFLSGDPKVCPSLGMAREYCTA